MPKMLKPPKGTLRAECTKGYLDPHSACLARSLNFAIVADLRANNVNYVHSTKGRIHYSFDSFVQPSCAVLSADDKAVYVVTAPDNGHGALLKLTLATSTITTICDGLSMPKGLAVSSDSTFAIVSEADPGRLMRVDLTKPNPVPEPFAVARETKGARGLALAHDDSFLLVANFMSDTVARVNMATGATEYYKGFMGPHDVALAPDDSFALVADWSANAICFINLTTGVTHKCSGALTTVAEPRGIDLAADCSCVMVTGGG